MKTLGLTAERARELLSYDPETGVITRIASQYRPDWVGKPAGSVNNQGYLGVQIGSVKYRAHRLAWLLHFGAWPVNQIDHINGDRLDNRIANLRDVTNSENLKNAARIGAKSLGPLGVTWLARLQKWEVGIHINGKRTYLGVFDNLLDAAAARKAAELAHGYHPNHGRRAA